MSWQFDDRREIYRLLKKITPAKRREWLDWCCTLVKDNGFTRTGVVASDNSVDAVFWDALSLRALFGVDLETMGVRLEQMVRGRR